MEYAVWSVPLFVCLSVSVCVCERRVSAVCYYVFKIYTLILFDRPGFGLGPTSR